MLNLGVKIYLDKFDRQQKPLESYCGERAIATEIKTILDKHTDRKSDEDIAECIAFDFGDLKGGKEVSCWGTYYGPAMTWSKDGRGYEAPSIQQVNETTLEYWHKRARGSKNPILVSRYADLAVDFSPKIIKKSADIECFRIVIDANIAIVERSLLVSQDCIRKIKRALNLAIGIKDQDRIAKAKKTIIELERRIATDDKAGNCGFAFEWLMLEFAKKMELEQTEKDELVKWEEDRLRRIENDPNLADGFLPENTVSRLARHYANKNDEDNLMRVLAVWEKTLKTNERINSSSLLKLSAYQRLDETYRRYRDKGFQQAKRASARILQEMEQLNLNWERSRKEILRTNRH